MSVPIRVLVPSTVLPGDRFLLFGEFTGAAGAAAQESETHVPAYRSGFGSAPWQSQTLAVGWLRGQHLKASWLGIPARAEWLHQAWLLSKWLDPNHVVFTSLRLIYGFGRYDLTVKTYDSLGNHSAGNDITKSLTITEPPQILATAEFSSYASSRVTFALTHY